MKYEIATADATPVRRNVILTKGQMEALTTIKKVSGVPITVSVRKAIDEYLVKLSKNK